MRLAVILFAVLALPVPAAAQIMENGVAVARTIRRNFILHGLPPRAQRPPRTR